MNLPTPASVKLSLDRLELRDAPAAGVTLVGSRLHINGDATNNTITVSDDGRGNVTATVTSGGITFNGGGKGITKIVISAGDGNDSVYYNLTKNRLNAEELDVDLGAGNDRVGIDLYRGISGVPLDLEVNGGAGNDTAEVRFGTITDAKVNFAAALGTGADNLTVVMFSGLSGKSQMTMDIAGNTGADRVDLNLMGKIDAGATLNIHASNSADANDRLIVRYKGELDGKMNVDIDHAAAVYGVQGHFSLDAASNGKLSAVVDDGKMVYKSSVIVTDHTGGPKVSILDRLGRFLTESAGTKATFGK